MSLQNRRDHQTIIIIDGVKYDFSKMEMKQLLQVAIHNQNKDIKKIDDNNYGSVIYRDQLYLYDNYGSLSTVTINNQQYTKHITLTPNLPSSASRHHNLQLSIFPQSITKEYLYRIVNKAMINNVIYFLCQSNGDSQQNCEYRIWRYNVLSRKGELMVERLPYQLKHAVNTGKIIFESLFNMYIVLIAPIKANKDNHQNNNNIMQVQQQNLSNNMQHCEKSDLGQQKKNVMNSKNSTQLRGWMYVFGQWKQMGISCHQTQFDVKQQDQLVVRVGNDNKLYVCLLKSNSSINTVDKNKIEEQKQQPSSKQQQQQQSLNFNNINNKNLKQTKLYTMTINSISLQLTIQPIPQNNPLLFKKNTRSLCDKNTQLTVFNQTLLFLTTTSIALLNQGQKQIKNINNKISCHNCRWMFDLKTKQWKEVNFLKDNFLSASTKKKSLSVTTHSINCLNKLSIIRVYSQQGNKAQLYVARYELCLNDNRNHSSQQKTSSFSLSKKIKNLRQQQQNSHNQISMTTNMLHSLSYSIRFPFHAILKIVEFLQQRFLSSTIRLTSQTTTNTINKYMYLSFEFDSNCYNFQYDDYNFQQEIEKQPKEVFKKYEKLFCYSLRLGKTVLIVEDIPLNFINKQRNENSDGLNNQFIPARRVTLISADSRFSPMLEHKPIFYTYIETYQHVYPTQRQKVLINEILSTLISETGEILSPQSLISKLSLSAKVNNNQKSNQNKVFIFSPNIIPTSKNYFYELVFDSVNDVGLFKNNKKVEMIQKLGYGIGSSMECSLMAFLRWRSIDNKMSGKQNKKNEINREIGGNNGDILRVNKVYNNENNEWIMNKQTKQVQNVRELRCSSRNKTEKSNKQLESDLIISQNTINNNNIDINKNKISQNSKSQLNNNIMNNHYLLTRQYIIKNSQRQKAKIYLSSSTQPINTTTSYLQYLQKQYQQNHLTQIPLTTNQIPYIVSVQLYFCHSDYFLVENNGILLYSHQKKLINRYDCEFGDLLQQKFYQKRFIKKTINENNRTNNHNNINKIKNNITKVRNNENNYCGGNLFNVVGVIELSQDINLINFRTEIKKNNKYLKLMTKLQQAICQFTIKYYQQYLQNNNNVWESKQMMGNSENKFNVQNNQYIMHIQRQVDQQQGKQNYQLKHLQTEQRIHRQKNQLKQLGKQSYPVQLADKTDKQYLVQERDNVGKVNDNKQVIMKENCVNEFQYNEQYNKLNTNNDILDNKEQKGLIKAQRINQQILKQFNYKQKIQKNILSINNEKQKLKIIIGLDKQQNDEYPNVGQMKKNQLTVGQIKKNQLNSSYNKLVMLQENYQKEFTSKTTKRIKIDYVNTNNPIQDTNKNNPIDINQ